MKRLNTRPAWILMGIIIILDQASKILTRAFTTEGQSIPILQNVFGETFRFTHLQNPGAAFSISLSNPIVNRIFFIATSILAVVFIIYLLYRAMHRLQVWAFGLILGGAIGNLVDRIFVGTVTDFVDVDIPDMFGMTRFPVFNVADSAIFIGMVLLIIDIIFLKDEGKKQPLPAEEEDSISKQGVIDE